MAALVLFVHVSRDTGLTWQVSGGGGGAGCTDSAYHALCAAAAGCSAAVAWDARRFRAVVSAAARAGLDARALGALPVVEMGALVPGGTAVCADAAGLVALYRERGASGPPCDPLSDVLARGWPPASEPARGGGRAPKQGQPWSAEDDEELARMAKEGGSPAAIAEALGRSQRGVQMRLHAKLEKLASERTSIEELYAEHCPGLRPPGAGGGAGARRPTNADVMAELQSQRALLVTMSRLLEALAARLEQ